jgi:transcriptional regulator with XRE-family HTH domain
MTENLAALVKARIKRLYDERRFTQTALAKELGVTPSAVNGYFRTETPVTLDLLEAVSALTHIPVGELVAPDGSLVKQLDADEAALLRYARSWPKSVLHGLLVFLRYWADEPPVVQQTRKLHEFWRVMPMRNKDAFFGLAAILSERVLEPDLLEQLTAHVKDEHYTQRADDAKRRGSGKP